MAVLFDNERKENRSAHARTEPASARDSISGPRHFEFSLRERPRYGPSGNAESFLCESSRTYIYTAEEAYFSFCAPYIYIYTHREMTI